MKQPSLRKLEDDLKVNKTTLHNWKKNRPQLFEFIIESYKDKELLKKNLNYMVSSKDSLEDGINNIRQRVC